MVEILTRHPYIYIRLYLYLIARQRFEAGAVLAY